MFKDFKLALKRQKIRSAIGNGCLKGTYFDTFKTVNDQDLSEMLDYHSIFDSHFIGFLIENNYTESIKKLNHEKVFEHAWNPEHWKVVDDFQAMFNVCIQRCSLKNLTAALPVLSTNVNDAIIIASEDPSLSPFISSMLYEHGYIEQAESLPKKNISRIHNTDTFPFSSSTLAWAVSQHGADYDFVKYNLKPGNSFHDFQKHSDVYVKNHSESFLSEHPECVFDVDDSFIERINLKKSLFKDNLSLLPLQQQSGILEHIQTKAPDKFDEILEYKLIVAHKLNEDINNFMYPTLPVPSNEQCNIEINELTL